MMPMLVKRWTEILCSYKGTIALRGELIAYGQIAEGRGHNGVLITGDGNVHYIRDITCSSLHKDRQKLKNKKFIQLN